MPTGFTHRPPPTGKEGAVLSRVTAAGAARRPAAAGRAATPPRPTSTMAAAASRITAPASPSAAGAGEDRHQGRQRPPGGNWRRLTQLVPTELENGTRPGLCPAARRTASVPQRRPFSQRVEKGPLQRK